MIDKRLRHGGMNAALFFALCALVFLRFRDFFPSVFYGDDLAMFMYVHGAESNDPNIAALLSIIGGTKFRPVFTGLLTTETFLFAKHLGRYFAINVAINALAGVAAFAVFARLSGSRIVAALLAVTLVTSRFALYQVTQVTGQVESLPFLFFILTVFFAYQAVVDQDIVRVKRYEWVALLLAALAFHAHERYIVALVWLLLVFVLSRRSVGRSHRLAFVGTTLAILIFNAAVKHFAMHASFFEGTGGQKITLSVSSIVELATQAALSVFGMNTGPAYLIGVQWSDLPTEYQNACIGFAIVAALIVLVAAIRSKRTGAALVSFPLLLLLAGMMLAAPATMTIRMEQRWELGPFFILLTLISVWVGNQANRSWQRIGAGVIAGAMVVCHIAIEQEISKSFPNIFMMSEAAYARAVKDSISTMPRGKDIVLIGESSHCNWGLVQGRGLFDFYEGASRSAICVSDASEARRIAHGRPVFASVSTTKIADVTSHLRDPYAHGIDLMSRFHEAQILNTTPEDTPTRTGVFDAHWDWVLGNQKTLVVLSNHGLTFRNVHADKTASLGIDVGMLFPVADSSEVVVTIRQKDETPREVLLRLPKLPYAERPNTGHFDVPVPELSNGPADITIALRTPSGNLVGAWAGFTSIYLVYGS